MATRILPAVGDPDAARALSTLAAQLPAGEPLPAVTDSTRLLDLLQQVAAGSAADLPEVVLVHELIGPAPALELIREVALRFPSIAVVLVTQDTTPVLYSAAMDAGARGVVGLPLAYDELAARVEAAATWAAGVRHHLGHGPGPADGPGAGGTVVAVAGAKGGVGCTLSAVQIALAARASGRDTALVDMNLQSGDVASFLDVQFRRSVVDLAGISDLTPRVLADAVFTHDTGLALLLAPAEGERGEEVDDRTARQVVAALRSRYEVVVVDCGTQMHAANAAAVELADQALLVTTPDVIAVRAAKRMTRLWDRLQVRKAEDTVTVVNRASRHTEIQPSLVARIVGAPVARATVPAGFKELHTALDAGRIQDVDDRSPVKQALWTLAAEIGAAAPPQNGGRNGGKNGGKPGKAPRHGRGRPASGSGPQAVTGGPTQAALPPGPPTGPTGPTGAPSRFGSDRGALTVEFAGMVPLVLVVLALLWQCVLIGYTFTLAGNAADEAARAASAAAAYGDPAASCEAAARAHLPSAWNAEASVSCSRSGNLWRADVDLATPVLFPGAGALPFTVSGAAGAAVEARR